jgi:hypothetical protein
MMDSGSLRFSVFFQCIWTYLSAKARLSCTALKFPPSAQHHA